MRRASVLAIVAVLLPIAAPMAHAGDKTLTPPLTDAYGLTLEEWMTLFWSWNFLGEGTNPVVTDDGPVMLLPLPAGDPTGGTGSVNDPYVFTRRLEVGLNADEAFALSILSILGFTTDGKFPRGMMTSGPINVTLDGVTLIDQRNASQYYYGPTPLDIPYGEFTIGFAQGVGFVNPPLAIGTHVLELDATLKYFSAFPPSDPGTKIAAVRYVNTWTITVVPTQP